MSLDGNLMPRRRTFEKGRPWRCHCREAKLIAGSPNTHFHPGYLKRCPGCKMERPR